MTPPPRRQRLAIIAAGDMQDEKAITIALDTLGHRGLDAIIHDANGPAAAIALAFARQHNLQRMALPHAKPASLIRVLRELEEHMYTIEVHVFGEAKPMAIATRLAGITLFTHQLGATKVA